LDAITSLDKDLKETKEREAKFRKGLEEALELLKGTNCVECGQPVDQIVDINVCGLRHARTLLKINSLRNLLNRYR
jgi:hypothetical protein